MHVVICKLKKKIPLKNFSSVLIAQSEISERDPDPATASTRSPTDFSMSQYRSRTLYVPFSVDTYHLPSKQIKATEYVIIYSMSFVFFHCGLQYFGLILVGGFSVKMMDGVGGLW